MKKLFAFLRPVFLAFVLAILPGASACRAEALVPQTVPQSRAQMTLSFAPLVKQITPAVVNIYTQRLVKQNVSPLFNDPFFRQFFGGDLPQGMTRQRMENSLGSGVIVRADGLVITTRHVIANADQIRVVLSDRREFDAKVAVSDERTDLAILRMEAKGEAFPFLELKDSDEALVGDLVLAVGNPFGVGQTVTSGIISALTHKSIGAGDLGYYIQTDAAINPGNSGGALVTMDGKLIGINAAIFSRDGGNMGIGFAIPSNMAKLLMTAAAQGKSAYKHPWTGIEGQEMTQGIATSLGLAQPSGFLVKSVYPLSPAAKAGLKSGDVIVSVNGKEIIDPGAFSYRIGALPIGSTAELGLIRGGQRTALKFDLIPAPEIPARDTTTITGENPFAGAEIANISPALAEEMDLANVQKGVVVTNVKDGTVAARVGIKRGDILAAVNDQALDDVDKALKILRQSPHAWKLIIKRGGNNITVVLGAR